MRTIEDLQQKQALPLNLKVRLTKRRIKEWVNEFGEDGVYVSFSGGKDSTVLLHLVREEYPNVPAVFCDTGLEYPEIREFVKTFDNVTWLKPKMNFRKVIETYGYPFISKEVSECVYGARKYLTSVMESASLDRQTDRQTDIRMRTISKNYVDTESMLRKSRGGNDRKYRKMRGIGEFGKPSTSQKSVESEAVALSEISPISQESELIKAVQSISGYGVAIDNIRVQRLMGILPLKGKATMESIPNEADRSMFSCVRYQFFLDAPFEISQKCCNVMKKAPFAKYEKESGRKPFTAMMASESRLRTQQWLASGCNAFDANKPKSNPMSFWTEQDVLLYILQNNLPICSVYGEIEKVNEVEGQMDLSDLGLFELERPLLKTTGLERTGCMFCGFGCHLEKPGNGRFERMKETHPKQYEYIMKPWADGGLGYKEVIDWINEHGNLNIRY